MPPKTESNIARWVAQAVGETIPIEGTSASVSVSGRYEANAGDYERVVVRADRLEIPPEERFEATVEGHTIQFMALESRGGGEYLLRVKVD